VFHNHVKFSSHFQVKSPLHGCAYDKNDGFISAYSSVSQNEILLM